MNKCIILLIICVSLHAIIIPNQPRVSQPQPHSIDVGKEKKSLLSISSSWKRRFASVAVAVTSAAALFFGGRSLYDVYFKKSSNQDDVFQPSHEQEVYYKYPTSVQSVNYKALHDAIYKRLDRALYYGTINDRYVMVAARIMVILQGHSPSVRSFIEKEGGMPADNPLAVRMYSFLAYDLLDPEAPRMLAELWHDDESYMLELIKTILANFINKCSQDIDSIQERNVIIKDIEDIKV